MYVLVFPVPAGTKLTRQVPVYKSTALSIGSDFCFTIVNPKQIPPKIQNPSQKPKFMHHLLEGFNAVGFL
jgi:hypothetical protein